VEPCDPDQYDHHTELEDHFDLPEDFSFEGMDPHTPPPIMETAVADLLPEVPPEFRAMRLLDRLVPAPQLFQDWETRSKIPFRTNYDLLESKQTNAVNKVNPFADRINALAKGIKDPAARTNIQLAFEHEVSGDTANAEAYRKLIPLKQQPVVDALKKAWNDYATSLGFNEQDVSELFHDFPTLRKMDGNFKSYVGSRSYLPRMVSLVRQQMEQGLSPLRIDERETNFQTIGLRLGRMMAYEKELTPFWNDTQKKMEDYFRVVQVPQDIRNRWRDYLTEVKHSPDDTLIQSMALGKKIIENLDGAMQTITRGKFGLKPNLTNKDTFDVLGAIASWGYISRMTYNPAQVPMQMMQILQTTAPRLGMKYTAAGLRYAVKWLKDEDLQKDMALRHITGQPLGLGEDITQSTNTRMGRAMNKVTELNQKGLKGITFADNFTRVSAYMGMHEAVMKEAPAYVDGKISFQQFRENTMLDLQDEKDGPTTLLVKNLLDQGDVRTAAHKAADAFQITSQFSYKRGSVPSILSGTMGRFLGRFGTWPLSFASSWGQLAFSGDKILTKNKVKAFGTVAALNYAMLSATSALFGANASRWSVWQAGWWDGGPYMHAGMDAMTVASAMAQGNADTPEAALAKDRLERFAFKFSIPYEAAIEHYYGAASHLFQGDLQGAGAAIMGLQPSQGPQPKGF
jgi:hypothetical protein